MSTYNEIYESFWKGLVETDGILDPDKVKRELEDYYYVIREVTKVYDELTLGKFTKPNTAAEHIIQAVYEREL